MWLESEYLHRILVLAALPISGYAIVVSLIYRESVRFCFAATFGLCLLTIAAFVEPVHDYETILTVTGALTLAVAHIGRWFGRGHARVKH